MGTDVLLEVLGYLASVLIAVSLMMRSIVRLRWINLVGAACFTVYGILIAAYPVAALNFAIVLINVYFLSRMRLTREAFAVLGMAPDAPYLTEFLRFYADDIQRFQPGFTLAAPDHQRAFVILRDMVPAGVLITEPRDGRDAWVALDYVTPAYRDFKIGDYLFNGRKDIFRNVGIDRLETSAGSPAHAEYLERIGFRRAGETYLLDLAPPRSG